ncbi:MAG: hypothetical protein V1917_02810 [Candidatus Gottesmanbacteria bacterium]
MTIQEQQSPHKAWKHDNGCAFITSDTWFLGECDGYRLSISEADLGMSDPQLIPITARSIAQYQFTHFIPEDFEKRYKDLQIVEVGAGLAEFSPHMTTIATKKPIVIEQANYHALRNLFVTAKHQGVPEAQIPTVDMLLDRIDTLLDPTKIRLFNMSIFEAVRHHGDELRGVGDIVLDVFGAVQYAKPWVNKQRVDEIENHFLSKSWWKGLK